MTGELRPTVGGARGVPVSLPGLEPGTHLISLYQGEAELARVASVFVGAGLAAGDRVLYVASDRPLPAARASLESANAAVGPAISAGQLALRSFADLAAGPGHLDLASVAGRFRSTADLARVEGFPGLRVAMEMGDFTQALGSTERMLGWERMAAHLQLEQGISSVCQYDRQQLGGELSGVLAAEHAGPAPQSAASPQASFLATQQGLRITGELDMANREEFIRVLRARLAAINHLTVEVGDVAFIDAGTLGALHRLAGALPAGRCITLTSASPQLQRITGILGLRNSRLTVESRP